MHARLWIVLALLLAPGCHSWGQRRSRLIPRDFVDRPLEQAVARLHDAFIRNGLRIAEPAHRLPADAAVWRTSGEPRLFAVYLLVKVTDDGELLLIGEQFRSGWHIEHSERLQELYGRALWALRPVFTTQEQEWTRGQWVDPPPK